MMHAQPIGPIEAQARAAAIARRNRLLGSPIAKRPPPVLRVVEKVEARPEPPVEPAKAKPEAPMLESRPAWSYGRTLFRHHVDAYYRHVAAKRKSSPVEFVRRRCVDLGMSYEDVIGKSRIRPIVSVRQKLMVEVWEKYRLSMPALGRLFGCRDHTTCLHALKKAGVKSAVKGMLDSRADEIRTKFLAGETFTAIAFSLACSDHAVRKFIRKNGWTRP